MRIRILNFVLFFAITATLSAQISGGVKIGLNFSQIKGPSGTNIDGTVAETTDNFVGFLIGPAFSYAFTDNFGLRGELLYSKKGTKYRYNGAYARPFTLDNSLGDIRTSGTAEVDLSVAHTNLDIPLMAYGRVGKFEFSAGPYVSLSFIRVADGSLSYNWKEEGTTNAGTFNANLTYNYRRDDPGGANTDAPTQVVEFGSANRKATVSSVYGAYYDYSEDKGSLYKGLDYGVMGGASFFMSRSLFLGARLQYGLADLTNNNADLDRATLGTAQPVYTNTDKDRNFTIQAVVGFSF